MSAATSNQLIVPTGLVYTAWLTTFGCSVKLHQNTLVVGARNYSPSAAAVAAGRVYVYVKVAGGWQLQQEVGSSGPGGGYLFGDMVSVYGDYMATTETGYPLNSGRGYISIFKRTGTVWSLYQGRFTSGGALRGYVGSGACALNGTSLLIGSPVYPTGGVKCGLVAVWVNNGTAYALQQYLSPTTYLTINGRFGQSGAIDGDRIAIGSPATPNGYASINHGTLYFYTRSGATWTLAQTFEPPGVTGTDWGELGTSVSMSSTYAVAGAPSRTLNGIDCGSVCVYKWSGTQWAHVAELPHPLLTSGAKFGTSVTTAGNRIIAADGFGSSFELDTYDGGATWTLMRTFSPTASADSLFGNAAIDPSSYLTVIGSQTYNPDGLQSGAVYAYDPPAVAVIPGAITKANVHGAATGAIAASSAKGGSATTYTWSWTRGAGTSSLTTTNTGGAQRSLLAGDYTATAADVVLHTTGSHTYTVGQNAALGISQGTSYACTGFGKSDGSIQPCTPSGGTGQYVFSWQGAAAVPHPTENVAQTGLPPGEYTITVSDSAGAPSVSYTYMLTEPPELIIVPGPVTDARSYGTASGSIGSTTASGGTGVYRSYTWTWQSGATAVSSGASGKNDLRAGWYEVTVKDSNDNATTHRYTVNDGPQVVVTPGAVTDASTYGGSDGAIEACTVSGGSGQYASYSWAASAGGSSIPTSAFNDRVSGLTAAVYTLTVTDSAGGTGQCAYTLAQPPPPPEILQVVPGAVTAATRYGASDGGIAASAAQGGVAPYTFAWSDGAVTGSAARSGLAKGQYVITVTDALRATAFHVYVIESDDVFSVLPGNASPSSGWYEADGQISVTGTGGGSGEVASVSWTTTTGAPVADATLGPLTGLLTGSYTITVEDTHGATASYTYHVGCDVVPLAIVPGTANDTLKTGSATGTISATGFSGGSGVLATVTWTCSAGATVIADATLAAKTGLKCGTYLVAIEDTAGYAAAYTYVIVDAVTLTLTAGAVKDASIYGGRDGAIGISYPVGGTAPFSYSWQSSVVVITSRLPKLTGLAAGTYVLSVSDAGGSSLSHSFTVGQRAALQLSPGAVTNVTVYGQSTGIIGPTAASGGDGSYTSTWSSPLLSGLGAQTDLPQGEYSLTVKDGGGSSASLQYVVTQPEKLTLSPGAVTHASDVDAADGYIAACAVSGGAGDRTAVWTVSEGGTPIADGLYAVSHSSLAPAAYTVSVTDAAGATVSYTYIVCSPLGVAASAFAAKLSWSTPLSAPSYYAVKYRQAGVVEFSTFAPKTTSLNVTIAGLTPLATYEFEVHAYKNGTGIRRFTSTVTLPAEDAPVPKAMLWNGDTFDLTKLVTTASVSRDDIIRNAFVSGDAVTLATLINGQVVTQEATVALTPANVFPQPGAVTYVIPDPTNPERSVFTLVSRDGQTTQQGYVDGADIVVGEQRIAQGDFLWFDGLQVMLGSED